MRRAPHHHITAYRLVNDTNGKKQKALSPWTVASWRIRRKSIKRSALLSPTAATAVTAGMLRRAKSRQHGGSISVIREHCSR